MLLSVLTSVCHEKQGSLKLKIFMDGVDHDGVQYSIAEKYLLRYHIFLIENNLVLHNW